MYTRSAGLHLNSDAPLNLQEQWRSWYLLYIVALKMSFTCIFCYWMLLSFPFTTDWNLWQIVIRHWTWKFKKRAKQEGSISLASSLTVFCGWCGWIKRNISCYLLHLPNNLLAMATEEKFSCLSFVCRIFLTNCKAPNNNFIFYFLSLSFLPPDRDPSAAHLHDLEIPPDRVWAGGHCGARHGLPAGLHAGEGQEEGRAEKRATATDIQRGRLLRGKTVLGAGKMEF